MNTEINIVAIKVIDRIKEAGKIQSVLSRHNSSVKTRFGFHELNNSVCSRNALIILELAGTTEKDNQIIEELKQIEGIKTEIMKFEI
ncbi:MAG: hypothetical protein PHE56_10930 [Bacteroidales bacterium]|nr:hypothetical protein [Bacteroidales bacterium]